MATSDKELELQLMEAGNRLVQPPSSVDDLILLLDEVESCLSRVEQSPSQSLQNALSPSLKALVAEQLFRHPDDDVKVAVAACISEITRITAPDAPYDDDHMKEVFQLIVSTFENLSDKSSLSFIKRTAILETVAKVRSCVVMLDLECDALIIEMFQHFLKAIRDYHGEAVFTSMMTIMTLVLEESEDISVELLSPLLASVRRDNEEVLPVAWRLAERVLENCASKLKPYLTEAVENLGISFDDYSSVVASICQGTPGAVEQNDAAINKHVDDESKPAEAPLDKPAQEDKVTLKEEVSTEQVDLANEKSPMSVVSNGIVQTAEDDSLADSNSVKNQEDDHLADKSKNAGTSTVAEPDRLEAEKVVNSDSKSEQSTQEKGRKSDSKSTEPSESSHVNEKEAESLTDHKNDSKDDASSPCEDPFVDGVISSENKRETDVPPSSPKATENDSTNVASPPPSGTVPDVSVDGVIYSENKRETDVPPSSPKATEKDSTDVTSPTQSGTVPDESHSKRAARPKRKESSENKRETDVPPSSPKATENDSTDVTSPPPSGTVPDASVDGVISSENKRETDVLPSSPKATENDSTDVTSPTPSGTVPDESHSKRAARPKRKESSENKRETDVPPSSPKATENDSTDVASPPPSGTVPDVSVDGVISSENQRETDVPPSSPKATENDSTDVTSPTPSGTVPDESHSKRAARPKRKESLSKEITSSVDDVSKKAYEGTSDSEAKTTGRSGKKVATVVSNEDNAPADVDETKKESGTASDSEAKSLKQLSKKVDSSSNKVDGSSSRQLEDKKRRARGKVVPEKDGTKTSTKDDDEEMVASPKSVKPNKHDSHMEETPKTNSKRKQTQSKEKASDSVEYGENLVGLKVKVWWPKDRVFYEGVIQSFDSVKKKHKVYYNDGDEEILNLKSEKWEVIEDESGSDEEEAADHPNPDGSSEMPQKNKAKTAYQPSKKAKMDASSKSGGGTSSGKSKGAATTSGRKTKEDGKVDGKSKDGSKSVSKSDTDNLTKSKDHTSKSGSKSVDVASKVGNKSKNYDSDDTPKSTKSKDDGSVTPKASTKSKQDTSKTAKSKQETPKISSNSKGKPLKSGGKSNTNGTGKSKSGSSKVKESESMKENSTDSAKVVESAKRKLPSSSKVQGSDSKSGKKWRR